MSINRKRVCVDQVESIHHRTEEETSDEEGKQLVNRRGQSKAMRKKIHRGLNWQNVWDEADSLVSGESTWRMALLEWSMGEGTLAKERRVNHRESTIFESIFKTTIAL